MATYDELRQCLDSLVNAIRLGKRVPREGALLTLADELVTSAARGDTTPVPWTPFEEARPTLLEPAIMERLAAQFGLTLEALAEQTEDIFAGTRTFVNSRYQVLIKPLNGEDGMLIWLSIKRIDQAPIREWRDLQRIKNELVNPEWEGVEIFPAESRLLDTANQYHLWVMRKGLIDFGFTERTVSDEAGIGEMQTPLEEGTKP